MAEKQPAATDITWWLLAACSGLLCVMLPKLLGPDYGDRYTSLLMVNGGLLFIGGFLGFCRPKNFWRWGIASVLLLPALDFVAITNDPRLSSYSAEYIMWYFADRMPYYVVQALPAMLGAYLGGYWQTGGGIVR